MSATPKASWGWVKALLHSVYDQPDAASVHAQFDRVVDTLQDKLPKVAEHLDAARADMLAFTASPRRSGGRSGRTTPRNGSTAKSAGAPTSSGSSPTVALIRLVGAVLAEQHDEWTEGRRYLGLDVLARSRVTLAASPGSDTANGIEVHQADDLQALSA